jgi:hypothetical protein
MTTDQQTEDFAEYDLSLARAMELLSGVQFFEMEDASWTWARPSDNEDGQYVAIAEGYSVGIYLTESDGDLVLAGHCDATGSASFEGDDTKAIMAAARPAEWRVAKDLDAIRRIVVDETASYAGQIEYACGLKAGAGKPDTITVTEYRVTVRYGGALPQAVAGPLKDNIVDALRYAGFDYTPGGGTVTIVPFEDD